MAEDLTQLPNIGPVLAEKLKDIGVESRADLAAIGSIEAMKRISKTDPTAAFNYNMLYALEGAIQHIRWHYLPKEERALLKEEFDLVFGN